MNIIVSIVAAICVAFIIVVSMPAFAKCSGGNGGPGCGWIQK